MRTLVLPRLSASESQALTAIAAGLGELSIPGPGESGTTLLAIMALSPDASPPEIFDPIAVHLEWSGAQFVLELPRRALDYWAAESLGSDLAELPSAWRDAALAQASQWLCDGLSDLGRGRAAIIGVLPEGTPAMAGRHRLVVRLMWPESGAVVLGVLRADTLGLLVCASLIPAVPGTSAANGVFLNLPIALRLTVGETPLPFSRLQSIRQGDVILVTEPFMDDDGAITLVYGDAEARASWTIAARIDANQITVTAPPASRTATDMPESYTRGDEPISLDQLPIRLSFDVGTKTLTLAELQALQPGATFALDRPAQEYLTIRANGAVIGSGQLVEIDGRLGVSVSSITASGGHS